MSKKFVHNVSWSVIEMLASYGVKFFFSIAIARILSPEDYGVIGILAFFISIGVLFSGGGFSAALIYKSDVKEVDYSTAFYFNFVIALLFYLIIFLFSDYLAIYFKIEELSLIAKVLSVTIIFNSLVLVQQTRFVKQLRFKSITVIAVLSSLIGGVVGLTLAYSGYGIWSLVFQQVTSIFVKFILYSIYSGIPCKEGFQYSSFIEQFSYGWKIFAQGLLNNIFVNIYEPLIANSYGIHQTGLYSRAKSFYNTFIVQSTLAITKVFFPYMTKNNNDINLLILNYNKAIKMLYFIFIPFVTFLILSSKSIVLFLLTDKWIMVVPFLQLFLVDGFILPFLLINLSTINSIGKSGLTLKINIFKRLLLLIGILIAYNMGIKELIISQVFVSLLVLLLSYFTIIRHVKVSLISIVKSIVPIIILNAILVIAILYIQSLYTFSTIGYLFINSVFFVFVYYYLTKIFRFELYRMFKKEIGGKLPIFIRKFI